MTYFEYCAVNGVAVLLFILFYTLLKMFFIAYMYEHFSKKNKKKRKKKTVFNFQDVTEFLIRRDDKHRILHTKDYVLFFNAN